MSPCLENYKGAFLFPFHHQRISNIIFINFMTKTDTTENLSTKIFIKNWSIYRKIIAYDNMSHLSGYSKLKQIIIDEMGKPFSFVDLACGDAYYSSKILIETNARKYTGLDISEQALSLATENFKGSQIEAEFIKADFIDFPEYIDSEADVIWVGFSVHHLDRDEKLEFMRNIGEVLANGGIFMLYEPILLEGEDLKQYYIRFKRTFDEYWKGLDPEESDYLLEHVRETEKPETREGWIALGKEAGFSTAEKVFSERTGLYEIFKYK